MRHARRHRLLGLAVLATFLAVAGGCSSSGSAAPTGTASGSGSGSDAGTASGGASGAPAGETPTSAGGAMAGSGKKACDLVTGAEAATALGAPAPLTAITDSEDACVYTGPNLVDSVTVSVDAQPYQPGTEDLAIGMLGAERAKKVSGLGQAALALSLDLQVQYHVWAQGRYLLIAVSKMDGGAGLDATARTLAETAVSRL